jgi:hypothetical protein
MRLPEGAALPAQKSSQFFFREEEKLPESAAGYQLLPISEGCAEARFYGCLLLQ